MLLNDKLVGTSEQLSSAQVNCHSAPQHSYVRIVSISCRPGQCWPTNHQNCWVNGGSSVWPQMTGTRRRTTSGFQIMGSTHYAGNKGNTRTLSSVTTNNVTCSICSLSGQVHRRTFPYRKDRLYQYFEKVLSSLTHETSLLCQIELGKRKSDCMLTAAGREAE